MLKYKQNLSYNGRGDANPMKTWSDVLSIRYGKNPSINDLRTFGCDIYPNTSTPKNLYDITQDVSFIGSASRRAIMK